MELWSLKLPSLGSSSIYPVIGSALNISIIGALERQKDVKNESQLEESSLCRTFIAILYYKLFWLKKALLELSFYLDDFLDQNQDYELQNLLKPIFSELKTVQNLTENLYTDYDSSHPSPETELQKYSSKRNTILDIL